MPADGGFGPLHSDRPARPRRKANLPHDHPTTNQKTRYCEQKGPLSTLLNQKTRCCERILRMNRQIPFIPLRFMVTSGRFGPLLFTTSRFLVTVQRDPATAGTKWRLFAHLFVFVAYMWTQTHALLRACSRTAGIPRVEIVGTPSGLSGNTLCPTRQIWPQNERGALTSNASQGTSPLFNGMVSQRVPYSLSRSKILMHTPPGAG